MSAVASLIVVNDPKSVFKAKIIALEISKERQEALGELFGIALLNTSRLRQEKIIETIIKDLKKYYDCQDLKIPLDFEKVFENGLGVVNRSLEKLFRQEKIQFEPQNFNILIGVLKNKTVIFSPAGRFETLLFHRIKTPPSPPGHRPCDKRTVHVRTNHITAIPDKDKSIASKQQEPETLVLEKIFTAYLRGDLGDDDTLLFSTKNLFPYIPLQILEQAAVLLPPKSAAEYIRNSLIQKPNLETATAIIIKVATAVEPPALFSHRDGSQVSMNKLLGVETQTEKILSPSLISSLQQFWANLRLEEIYNSIRNPKAEPEAAEPTRVKYAPAKQTELRLSFAKVNFYKLVKIVKVAFRTTKSLISGGIIIFKNIALLISNLNNQRKNAVLNLKFYFKGIGHSLKKSVINLAIYIRQLLEKLIDILILKFNVFPHSKKIILILVLASALALNHGLTYAFFSQKIQAKTAAYQNKVNAIWQKRDLAEAALIYNNKNEARRLLEEAAKEVETLSRKSTRKKETYQNVKENIESMLNKLLGMKKIENPNAIFTLPDEPVALSELALHNNSLYLWMEKSSVIKKINLRQSKSSDINLPKNTNNGQNCKITSGQNALFLLCGQNIFKLALENLESETQWQNLQIETAANLKTDGLKIYNKNLYLLDKAGNQIWKHNFQNNGFASQNPWLKDMVDLNNVQDFAVDGNVYFLKNNGEISKYSRGRKQNFKTESPAESLKTPTQICTDAVSSFLYILEPALKRLVVFSKTGALVFEYSSEKFDNLKNFLVAEKDKKIYLLNGKQIFEVAADHL